MAQEEAPKNPPIKAEMKEMNGESVLIVSKEENGLPTQKRYTGDEAQKMLTEIESEMGEEGKQVEVEVTETDAGKLVRVMTSNNGIEVVEEFTGEAADAKLKELENGKAREKRAKDFELTPQTPRVREKSVN